MKPSTFQLPCIILCIKINLSLHATLLYGTCGNDQLAVQYIHMLINYVLYLLQRTLEGNKARRKRRRVVKRQFAKLLKTSDQSVSNVQLVSKEKSESMQGNSDSANHQLLAYEKFQNKNSKEIDELIVKGL